MDQSFTPAPTRTRRDGWTPARQHAFIAALAETRCIAAACRRVGLSPRSAYTLRARPSADSFAAAWDAALVPRIDTTDGRATDGVARPVFYRGKQVGERRRYDDRRAMFLLAHLMPDRYGRAAIGRSDAEEDGASGAEALFSAPYHQDRELPRALDAIKPRDAPPPRRYSRRTSS